MTTIEQGKHEIEAVQLPNAEVFRELATHLQNWASQHQEYLQLLDTGHSNLKDSWEGDGSNAYTHLHTRSQEIGNTHLEHFQNAHHTLTKTSDMVEEAHEKKSSAWKWILGLAGLAILTLGVALVGIPAVIAGVVSAAAAAAAFFATAFGQLAGLLTVAIAAMIIAINRFRLPRTVPVNLGSLTVPSGIFSANALKHIFLGDINKKGVVSGLHYAASNAVAAIVSIVSTNPDGVFSAIVDGKKGNGGISTFFPTWMTPQDVVNAIATAYTNRSPVIGNTWEYTFPPGSGRLTGITIDMYLNAANQIISAFPVK